MDTLHLEPGEKSNMISVYEHFLGDYEDDYRDDVSSYDDVDFRQQYRIAMRFYHSLTGTDYNQLSERGRAVAGTY